MGLLCDDGTDCAFGRLAHIYHLLTKHYHGNRVCTFWKIDFWIVFILSHFHDALRQAQVKLVAIQMA